MARSTLRLNHSEIQSYLNGDHGVRETLREAADRVLSAAQSSAPVVSGDYQASLHVEEAHTDRLVMRVVADVPYALVVESESGNLARALDAAG